jgi:LacI family transcriptional regulator
MAALSRPALTTVRQPIERMGKIAFELLLERMISDQPTTGKRIVLDVRLIQRDSTKPLQA